MSLIAAILSQSGVEADREEDYTVSNLYGFGDYQQINPSMLWHNGKTIIGGNKSNATNNQIQLMVYEHLIRSFYVNEIGDGTDTQDAFNHPRTYLHIDSSDNVYCGQTNTHNDPIDIWKNGNKDNLRTAFTLFGQVSGDNAYAQLFTRIDNGNVGFYVRQFTGGGNSHVVSTQLSNGGIEGTFTLNEITVNDLETDGSNPSWHYNKQPIRYGNSTVHYFIVALRDQNDSLFYGFALLKTTDYITYSNYSGSFSKDTTSSEITNTELFADCMILGSSDRSVNRNMMNCIQVADVFYGMTKRVSDDEWVIIKVDNGVLTETVVDIPNISVLGIINPFLYYNGNNILISLATNDTIIYSKELWSTPMDLSEFTQKLVNSDISVGNATPFNLPENLDQVSGEYALVYQIVGSDGVRLYITQDKFYH